MSDAQDDTTDDERPSSADEGYTLGKDNPWLWLVALGTPIAAFLVSYGLGAYDKLDLAAHPPGIRIGLVQQLFGTDMLIALIFGGATLLVLLYFAIRYNASAVSAPEPMPVQWGGNTLRLLTIGVAVIILVTFMYAGTTLANTDQMPAKVASRRYGESSVIHMTVVGSQWAWRDTVQGVNYTETDTVRVPANTVVAVNITSTDVDHSWAVEQLGVKKDAIPGQITHTWFVAQPGTYQVNCAELCGKGHSKMTQTLIVMPKSQYVQWARSHGYSVPPSVANSVNATSGASQPAAGSSNDRSSPSTGGSAPSVAAAPASLGVSADV